MQNTFTRIILRAVLLLLLVSSTFSQNAPIEKIPLKTTNYEINFKPDFTNETLIAVCKITVRNSSNKLVNQIPLLLYRLLNVSSVKDTAGNKLTFTQNIRTFDDWGKLQVNFIQVDLPKPLKKDEEYIVIIAYDGYLLGYTETGMLYVKDNINPEFTILRPDCRAYPKIGYPNWKINHSSGFDYFDYVVSVAVPDTLVAANGGKLIDKITHKGYTTYTFKNIKQAWRIDVIISKYNMMENGKTKIYYFPEDKAGAERLETAWSKSFDLLTEWWGPKSNFNEFSLIEIPNGWGSQTDVTCIIQTADAFKNKNQMYQLYHEVTHLWNVKETDKYRARWQEGLAMFMQNLITEKLDNKPSVEKSFNIALKRVKSAFDKNPDLMKIPFIDFGKEGADNLSYRVGQMMFSILYNLLGEDNFINIHKRFYEKYKNSGARFNQFAEFYETNSGMKLKQFFNDWVFTPGYVKFLSKDDIYKQIINYYKS